MYKPLENVSESDGCINCVHESKLENEEPCSMCCHAKLLSNVNYFNARWVNNEMVDHPNHYNREGAMECIDEMVLVFGVEAVKNFCICNAWKYRYRASEKNGEEDFEKSNWYMRKYEELSGC